MDTPDPTIQAVLALCPHPVFVAGCGTCEIRRDECVAHLSRLADQVLAELD